MKIRDVIRVKHGYAVCDQSNLRYIHLKNKSFYDISLDHSMWEASKLTNVAFDNCVLCASHFADAKLQNVKFVNCPMGYAEFNRTCLLDVSFLLSYLNNCRFNETSFDNVNVKGVNMSGCYFNRVNFGEGILTSDSFYPRVSTNHFYSCKGQVPTGLKDRASVTHENQSRVNIDRVCSLQDATFVRCFLKNRDFSQCYMKNCVFRDCVLSNCVFPENMNIQFTNCIHR